MQWSNTSSKGGILEEIKDYVKDADFQTGGDYIDYLLIWANRVINVVNSRIEDNPYLYTETAVEFTENQNYITLPTDFDYLARPPVCNETIMQQESQEEQGRVDPYNKSRATWPTAYNIVGSKMYLRPIPNSTLGDEKETVTATDTDEWCVKATHISTNANKPVTGADYATYWNQTSCASTGETWYPGRIYGYGVGINYYKTPTAMAATTSTPNGIPTKFHHVVVTGVVHIVKLWLRQEIIRDAIIAEQLADEINQINRHINSQRDNVFSFQPNLNG